VKRHIFGGICQVLFRKKWGDFSYEQRKSLEKSRLRIPRRYAIGGEGEKRAALRSSAIICFPQRIKGRKEVVNCRMK